MSLHIDSVTVDHVATSIGTCTPSCAEDITTPVEWYLDRSRTRSCDRYRRRRRRWSTRRHVTPIRSTISTRSAAVMRATPCHHPAGTGQRRVHGRCRRLLRAWHRTSRPRLPTDRRPRGRRPRRTTHLVDAGRASPDGTSTVTASSTPTKSSGTSTPTAVEASSMQPSTSYLVHRFIGCSMHR